MHNEVFPLIPPRISAGNRSHLSDDPSVAPPDRTTTIPSFSKRKHHESQRHRGCSFWKLRPAVSCYSSTFLERLAASERSGSIVGEISQELQERDVASAFPRFYGGILSIHRRWCAVLSFPVTRGQCAPQFSSVYMNDARHATSNNGTRKATTPRASFGYR